MEIISGIVGFFNSPARRRISVILLLAAGIVIAIMVNYPSPVVHDSPRIVVCDNCGYRQQLRVAEKLNCPKCHKGMGCLWKCMICRYEYEHRPPKTKVSYDSVEAFRLAKIDSYRCPNCDSVETFPMTTLNMPEKNPASSK
ncbi:MAG: hypothetical protein WCS96_12230 [Victivallales bacterium]